MVGLHQKVQMPECKVRLAEDKDFKHIFLMLLKFINESPYKEAEVDPEEITEMINSFLESPKNQKVLLLAVNEEDKPVGLLAGFLIKHLFNKSKVASELSWWVEPEYRKSRIGLELLSAFEYWGRKVGAKYISLAALDTSLMDKLARLYKARGYTVTEKAFVKEIK